MVIQLGYPPNRIDLLTDLDDVDFMTCFEKREQLTVQDIIVNFIDLDSLIKTKKASGRMQDLSEVEKLERRK